jgi:hypothetical protein
MAAPVATSSDRAAAISNLTRGLSALAPQNQNPPSNTYRAAVHPAMPSPQGTHFVPNTSPSTSLKPFLAFLQPLPRCTTQVFYCMESYLCGTCVLHESTDHRPNTVSHISALIPRGRGTWLPWWAPRCPSQRHKQRGGTGKPVASSTDVKTFFLPTAEQPLWRHTCHARSLTPLLLQPRPPPP